MGSGQWETSSLGAEEGWIEIEEEEEEESFGISSLARGEAASVVEETVV